MKTLVIAPALALSILLGCSSHSPTGSFGSAGASPIDLGTVEVADGAARHYTLSGGKDCWVHLNALADNQVLVRVVVLRGDAQGRTNILARPETVANAGQEVTLDVGEGSVALTPKVKLTTNQR